MTLEVLPVSPVGFPAGAVRYAFLARVVPISYRSYQQMAQYEPNVPVVWGQWTADEVIPLVMAEECVRFLKLGLILAEDRYMSSLWCVSNVSQLIAS